MRTFLRSAGSTLWFPPQASADSQDSSVRRATLERQRLQGEADRLNQVLQAKDQVIRWVLLRRSPW